METVPAPCSYHAPLLITTTNGSRPSCGCGAISSETAAVELARLRFLERDQTAKIGAVLRHCNERWEYGHGAARLVHVDDVLAILV